MHNPDDGYLRISSAGGSPSRETSPTGANLSLLFVDLDVDDLGINQVTKSLQSAGCSHASVIIFRWNTVKKLGDNEAKVRRKIYKWLDSLAVHAVMAEYLRPDWMGVIRYQVSKPAVVEWICCGAGNIAMAHPNSEMLVDRSLRVEISAIFDWGHAVWRPTDYHYELPSGDHSAVFVKVSDAFRTPRDAMVAATWISARLDEDQVIITDNASLIPLVLASQLLCERTGWQTPRTITLEDYPATRLSVFNAMKSARSLASSALIVLSVNASGRFLSLIEEAAAMLLSKADIDYHIVIIADKMLPWTRARYSSDGTTTSWLGMSETIPNPLDSSTCAICRSSDRSQIVKVDPRSFEALALPGANLVMPDVTAARDSKEFWSVCFEASAVSVLSLPDDSPSLVAREKGEIMSVRISLARLLASFSSSADVLNERVRSHLSRSKFSNVDAIIVSSYEHSLEGFEAFISPIRALIDIDDVPLIDVDVQISITSLPDVTKRMIAQSRRPLLVSVGSVSGWNMRQMLVAVQQCWHEEQVTGNAVGLVLHSRPSSKRQWLNLYASFSEELYYLWQTFMPSMSPLDDERTVLGTITDKPSLPSSAQDFLSQRLNFCSPSPALHRWDDRVRAFQVGQDIPDPKAVLWGLSGQPSELVRNESLYGTRVNALTAYVAVGAAMHSRRENARKTDPRWQMFDFDSISRSYFDGILVASMLRWARPSECWWGATSHARTQAVTSLIARTRDIGDQRVLYPELLLAAYQGKIPREAVLETVSRIRADVDGWDASADRGPVELGIHLAEISDRLRT